ncbi:MAG: cytochrome P460 family protein [Methylococcaceae bacterium]|jgi:hypothetical protein
MTITRFSLVFLIAYGSLAMAQPVAPAPNGIEFPTGYSHWQSIALSHRTDKDSIRAILGNDIAVKAARTGATKPWPEGTILAKVSWQQRNDENWPEAVVPGQFTQMEIMLKNAKKYTETGGWGFARWRGKELKPWGDNADFTKECMACHISVSGQDYVFTKPATWADPN